MIKEAIILAGGLGTRLQSAVPDLPKCMAPVAGTPFLYYIIEYLKKQGIEKFIFSLGYKYEIITSYLSKNYPSLNYQLSIENEPLGTGGAIKLSCNKPDSPNIVVINGDTLFPIDLHTLSSFHISHDSQCTLCLKLMKNFDRYGVVELNDNNKIKSFKEKQFYSEGLINGGVYALNIPSFLQLQLPDKFSFEKDYLERYYPVNNIYGIIQDKYFIDIGIPEDYMRAQDELKIEKK